MTFPSKQFAVNNSMIFWCQKEILLIVILMEFTTLKPLFNGWSLYVDCLFNANPFFYSQFLNWIGWRDI